MISRVRQVSTATLTMLTVASACLAAEPGYAPRKGGIGGQLGGSNFAAGADYAKGAEPRFSFAAHFRYAVASWLRWQVSPGLMWAGYSDSEPVPFADPVFPSDATKGEYLTLLLPVSGQLQGTVRRGSWLYYVGGGPGLYRVWVQNHRRVLKDPVTLRLHRGVYPGASGQFGVERFFKGLPSTSVEASVDGHLVYARRDDQFPRGFNSKLLAFGVRIGANYYFDLVAPKKAQSTPLPPP